MPITFSPSTAVVPEISITLPIFTAREYPTISSQTAPEDIFFLLFIIKLSPSDIFAVLLPEISQ